MSFLPQGFAQLADDDPFSDSHSVPDPPSLPPRPAPPPKPPHHHASPAPTAHAPSAPPANTGLAGNTFTIHLGVGVRDIPKLDAFSLSDPMVAVFDARTGREFGRTETIWNVKSADFQQELKVTYSPAQNTTLKFVVVDTVS
ncbi:hypothetical protein DFJ74DRAFT_668017 [Hyaloraphidium curvatum]|nr:hypothetical protein DFJ74DRAFT_668017 [Hyaloraphidium curvatum]